MKLIRKEKVKSVYYTTGVSFPQELYLWAASMADEEGRSFSNWVARLIEKEKRKLQKAA